MIKCDICDSEATVFLTQIINGKMTTVNLCDKCSQDKGVTDPTGFQLADFLLGEKPKKAMAKNDDTLSCPACGFTRAHLKKIGRMGCPQCYQIFAEDLKSMLQAMHKGTRHVGKSPVNVAAASPEPSAPVGKQGQPETGKKSKATKSGPPVPPPMASVSDPSSPAQLKRKLADLKAAIEKAIGDERYEDAAKLRDQVREIESKLV